MLGQKLKVGNATVMHNLRCCPASSAIHTPSMILPSEHPSPWSWQSRLGILSLSIMIFLCHVLCNIVHLFDIMPSHGAMCKSLLRVIDRIADQCVTLCCTRSRRPRASRSTSLRLETLCLLGFFRETTPLHIVLMHMSKVPGSYFI